VRSSLRQLSFLVGLQTASISAAVAEGYSNTAGNSDVTPSVNDQSVAIVDIMSDTLTLTHGRMPDRTPHGHNPLGHSQCSRKRVQCKKVIFGF